MEPLIGKCLCGQGRPFNLHSRYARSRHRAKWQCKEVPFLDMGKAPIVADPVERTKRIRKLAR